MSAPSVIERVKTTLVALKMPRASSGSRRRGGQSRPQRLLQLDRIRYYCRFALLIVGEIGYLPVTVRALP